MGQKDFRFDPPALAPPPAALWMLVRVLGPPGAAAAVDVADVADIAPEAALALARRFEVAARIAARQGKERLAAELGEEGALAFERERWATAASGVRLLEAVREVEETAAALGLPLAWLKHAALEAMGLPVLGRRGACDVDVLVPAARAGELQQALVERGFIASREGAEHQLPALAHPEKGAVEIHRLVPGVRPGGPGGPRSQRSATFETLAAAGLLAPVAGRAGAVHVPAPAALAAHLLVHGLAQHGFWPHSYSLLKMVADLVDLGLGRDAGLVERAGALAGRDVAPGEIEATAGLCRALEAGRLPAPESPAGRLLAHILAGRLDPDYEKALRLGVFRRQPSDRPEAVRLLRSLATTVFLTRARVDAIYGPPRGPLGYLGRQVARPFDLLWRLGVYGARRLRRERT